MVTLTSWKIYLPRKFNYLEFRIFTEILLSSILNFIKNLFPTMLKFQFSTRYLPGWFLGSSRVFSGHFMGVSRILQDEFRSVSILEYVMEGPRVFLGHFFPIEFVWVTEMTSVHKS